jgi:hypothetical protein
MSRWTKKDYIETANILSKLPNGKIKNETVAEYERKYEADNPKFDSITFRSAIDKKSYPVLMDSKRKRRINEFIRKTEDEKLKKELR